MTHNLTAGAPLQDLTGFKRLKKGGLNAKGIKRQKKRAWNVSSSKFEVVPAMAGLVGKLFDRAVDS
jgi:hypothetical protein